MKEKYLVVLGEIEEAAVLGMKRRYCQKYTERACSGCPMGSIRMRSLTVRC